MDSPLRIYITGRVALETPEQLIEAPELPGRQGRLALVLLASAPRRWDRDVIADVLWGDEVPEAWETALAAIVSKLRKIFGRLGLNGQEILESSHGSYSLRPPVGTWIDLRAAVNALDKAEGHLRRAEPREAWSQATVATTVFRRTFLAGEHGPWVEQMRRDIHEYEIRAFDVVTQVWLALDNPTAALYAAQRVVDLAPYRESAHARLMEAHLAAGNGAEALRVYNRLRDVLAETLGITPGARTEELYEQAIR